MTKLTVDILHVLTGAAIAANVAALAYAVAAIYCLRTFRQLAVAAGTFQPPVTILKPICGLDVALYENLRSFCRQDYPCYQIVFGVLDAADPAIPTVERLIEEFRNIDISLIVDGGVRGDNLKVSNLANMVRAAKHDILVIADSDMRVDQTYLSTVVASFADPQVGAVTCLYKGTPIKGVASFLASMFINEWFLPSVLVGAKIREIRFCFGATMAVRRPLLEAIGGFQALSYYLADDHMLGKLVSEQGFKVALSGYVVENVVSEESLAHMFRHELRWARTVRTVEPLGHAFSFITYGIPLALIAGLMIESTLGWKWFAIGLIALAFALRAGIHITARRKLGLPKNRSWWFVPLRDMISFAVWGASQLGRTVEWRGRPFVVRRNGFIVAKKGSAP